LIAARRNNQINRRTRRDAKGASPFASRNNDSTCNDANVHDAKQPSSSSLLSYLSRPRAFPTAPRAFIYGTTRLERGSRRL
jgi:hypothetical protein